MKYLYVFFVFNNFKSTIINDKNPIINENIKITKIQKVENIFKKIQVLINILTIIFIAVFIIYNYIHNNNIISNKNDFKYVNHSNITENETNINLTNPFENWNNHEIFGKTINFSKFPKFNSINLFN